MVASSLAGKPKPELVTFIEEMSALIAQDRYADAATAIAAFTKAHPGLEFFIDEALPAKVTDHILKKTNAHSAFTTYTLRHPNWVTELGHAATDPEHFASMVAGIEAGVLEIAGKKAAA